MNTPCRSSFHHLLVAIAGARRSTSRASASAARRTSPNVHSRVMRTFTWMPREPDVFGQPTSPKSDSARLHDLRDLANLVPLDARHRIEIDAQFVGMIEIVGAHRMRVQLETGEIRHPRERGCVARHDFFRRSARRKTAA